MPNNQKTAGQQPQPEEEEEEEGLISSGYAERVPDIDLKSTDGRVWYTPHNRVHHPETRKIWVLFDCGASLQDASLSEHFLQALNLHIH